MLVLSECFWCFRLGAHVWGTHDHKRHDKAGGLFSETRKFRLGTGQLMQSIIALIGGGRNCVPSHTAGNLSQQVSIIAHGKIA